MERCGSIILDAASRNRNESTQARDLALYGEDLSQVHSTDYTLRCGAASTLSSFWDLLLGVKVQRGIGSSLSCPCWAKPSDLPLPSHLFGHLRGATATVRDKESSTSFCLLLPGLCPQDDRNTERSIILPSFGMWLFAKAQQVRIYAAFDFSCSATVQLAPHCLRVPVRLASILFCLDAARTSRHAPPTTGKSWSSCTIRVQTDIHGATYRC